MKPVTGNNITEAVATQSILSIQHTLDGLSFCVSRFGKPLWLHPEGADGLTALRAALDPLQQAYPRIRVIADTDQVCLIPESHFDETAAASFMQIRGILPSEEMELVIHRKQGYVWLMHLSREFCGELSGLFPQARIEYIHPLWFGIRRASAGSFVDVNLSADWAHVVVTQESTLHYAETVPCRTPADLLYILSELQRLYELNTSEFIFSGRQAETFRKQTALYYKKPSLDLPVPPKSVRPAEVPLFANLIRAAYENY